MTAVVELSRHCSELLAHLSGMSGHKHDDDCKAEMVTLAELADYLRVPIQTLYDLRSQGRGPRGIRIGRELRFRWTEISDWLDRFEEADAERQSERKDQE